MLATLERLIGELDEVLVALDPAALHPRDAVKLLDDCNRDRKARRRPSAHAGGRAGRGQQRLDPEGSSEPGGVAGGQDRHQLRRGQGHLGDLGQARGPAPAPTRHCARASSQGTRSMRSARRRTGRTRNACSARPRRRASRGSRAPAPRRRPRPAESMTRPPATPRIHKERHHRSWTDAEGGYCYSGRTTAMAGAQFDAALAAEAEKVFKAAHAEGRRESAEAYRADALLNLVTSGGASVDTTVVIRVDASALRDDEGMAETHHRADPGGRGHRGHPGRGLCQGAPHQRRRCHQGGPSGPA